VDKKPTHPSLPNILLLQKNMGHKVCGKPKRQSCRTLYELKTLIAIYRVIAKTINAVEVVNENRDLKEVLEEVIGRIRLANSSPVLSKTIFQTT